MLYLSHATAAAYWRLVGAGILEPPIASDETSVLTCPMKAREICSLVPEQLMAAIGRIDYLVPEKRMMHAGSKICAHTCPARFPSGSFFAISENVLVASPELCWLQAVQTRTVRRITLIELAMELAGGYSLDDGNPRGFSMHNPFSCTKSMQEYLDSWGRPYCAEKAKQVLGYASDRSVSPRETECNLVLTLPKELGGYGIAKPVCNLRIDIAGDARHLTSQTHYMADMTWEKSKTIFEYDGMFDHSAKQHSLNDKDRRSVLAALGYGVIVATNEQTGDYWLFEQKVEQLASLLGLSLEQVDDETIAQRMKLERWLFNPGHLKKSTWTTPLPPCIDGVA